MLSIQAGDTALMKASSSDNAKIVKYLVDKGADVNIQCNVSAVHTLKILIDTIYYKLQNRCYT